MTEYEGEFCETPFGGSRDGYKSQQTPRAAYAAMVTYLDKTVGLIIKDLKEKGLYDHTIIVFTSDNGVHSEGGTIHLILTVMVRSEVRKEIYMKEVSVLRSSFNGRELFHKG